MITYTLTGYPNLGLIFCRFIYVRYSHGLVKDKGELFHQLILLIIGIFTIHWLLIWPLRTTLSGEDYKNMIKGKICNKMSIAELTGSDIQAKLITISVLMLTIFGLLFMKSSVMKKRKVLSIPKTRWNLINFSQHSMYLQLFLLLLFVDQVGVNTICQIFNQFLGTKLVFQLWWIWNLIMFLLLYVGMAIVLIFWALRDFPEFTNLRPRLFPGQEEPRKLVVVPERLVTIYKENSEIRGASLRTTRERNKKYMIGRHMKMQLTNLGTIWESNTELTEVVID